jgi:hypothetical protein
MTQRSNQGEAKAENSKLRIDLPYNRPAPKNGEDRVSDVELTDDYIGYAVNNVHKDGLEGQMRRIYGRIQRKIEEAIKSGAGEIELEQAEKDFLRKAFKDCKVPSGISKFFVVLEDEIERATARS